MPTLREAMVSLKQAKKDIAATPLAKQPAALARHLAMMELLHYCDNSETPLTAKELRRLQAWMNMYIIQAFQIEPSKVLAAFDEFIEKGYWAHDAVDYARQYAQLLGVMLA